MTRTDDDSWDINESVGVTALGVAAARAAETESENPLIEDRFARLFVDAAGTGMWRWYSGEVPAEIAEAVPELPARMRMMIDFLATRTAFIDRFFLDAADAGLRQVVILAAGLDARAWRLPWPDGTVVYELDQPQVLEFKAATLRDHEPTCRRVSVPIDLRQDWPKALCDAGFDVSALTAWSAEGLLRYLPAQAQDLLFERIDSLSAAGSRLVANAPTDDALNPERVARERAQMQRIQAAVARTPQPGVTDLLGLAYNERRTDLVDWLTGHGWDATAVTAAAELARYGRDVTDAPPTVYVSARRR
jgi:methyltransferase (TIGR00027 family)